MGWAGRVTRMVKRRDVYRGLVGKREGKRPLGRPRLRWQDNININITLLVPIWTYTVLPYIEGGT